MRDQIGVDIRNHYLWVAQTIKAKVEFERAASADRHSGEVKAVVAFIQLLFDNILAPTIAEVEAVITQVAGHGVVTSVAGDAVITAVTDQNIIVTPANDVIQVDQASQRASGDVVGLAEAEIDFDNIGVRSEINRIAATLAVNRRLEIRVRVDIQVGNGSPLLEGEGVISSAAEQIVALGVLNHMEDILQFSSLDAFEVSKFKLIFCSRIKCEIITQFAIRVTIRCGDHDGRFVG